MKIIDVTTEEFITLFNDRNGRAVNGGSTTDLESALNEPLISLRNNYLIAGGIMSFCAALLHLAIIVGGPEWYRFFGAGEDMAVMAHNGSWYPAIVTLVISLVLFTWALYAFSGASQLSTLPSLPFLKPVLIGISAVYVLRGLAIIPTVLITKDLSILMIWTSCISLIIGLCFVIGTYIKFKTS